ncbi:MAG TPA: histidine kinase [Pyrinomonadaceae bacterium]
MPNPTAEFSKKSRPYWLLIAAACLVPAFLDALRSFLNSKFVGGGRVDWGDVVFAGSEWLFLGALTPIAYVLARRFPLKQENRIRNLGIHFLGSLLLCFGWATLGILLGMMMSRYPAQKDLGRSYVSWLLTSLPWSVFMYFTVLGCVYAFSYYQEARERETREARLAAQLSEAKLGALRMQLHPHFLFNSLNAITVLVRDQKTREASDMLELLSRLLRQVLQSDQAELIPLRQELQFIEKYLGIEQVRFSDRLSVRWEIDDSARDALVPAFVLQPLVENAVRHGVAKRVENGLIEVIARREGATLILIIRDNGPGYQRGSPEGVGLTNTRARLAAMYGADAELRIESDARGTSAVIRMPFVERAG